MYPTAKHVVLPIVSGQHEEWAKELAADAHSQRVSEARESPLYQQNHDPRRAIGRRTFYQMLIINAAMWIERVGWSEASLPDVRYTGMLSLYQ